MSLRDLSTQTMVTLSAAWLDPAHARSSIEALPTAAGLLPKVDTAHRRLLKAQPARAKPKTPPELTAIQVEQSETDVVHDRNARGAYNVLTGFAELADTDEQATAILGLRDKLFPPERGLNVIKMSYADEAGEATLVEKRLTDEDRALLKKLPIPGGTLLDAHKARVNAGKKLGDLDQQRVALEAKEALKAGIKSGDALQARNGWIKVVRTLVDAIDLDEPSVTVRKRILQPLEDAERKAEKRRLSKASGEPVEPEESVSEAEDGEKKPE
jgi:hypothetical protein